MHHQRMIAGLERGQCSIGMPCPPLDRAGLSGELEIKLPKKVRPKNIEQPMSVPGRRATSVAVPLGPRRRTRRAGTARARSLKSCGGEVHLMAI
jgi:hypothetical protein